MPEFTYEYVFRGCVTVEDDEEEHAWYEARYQAWQKVSIGREDDFTLTEVK
jgi:hypothetical protein